MPGVLDVDIINNRNIVRKHLRGKGFIYGNARPVLNFKKIIRKLWGNHGNPKNSRCHSDVSLANAIKIQMLVSSEKIDAHVTENSCQTITNSINSNESTEILQNLQLGNPNQLKSMINEHSLEWDWSRIEFMPYKCYCPYYYWF